ncbi:hypothetical protein [Thiohalocapsa halophila]|uniref:hypothetical protein n=1 Tax=Thiohalocapsa halophila TaxID=69359 RepID=UPI0019065BD1|nr:hypothetical protein [Thiohalocapsa halophila]
MKRLTVGEALFRGLAEYFHNLWSVGAGSQRELARLGARLRREIQLNRRVVLNRQVRAPRQAVQSLNAQ